MRYKLLWSCKWCVLFIDIKIWRVCTSIMLPLYLNLSVRVVSELKWYNMKTVRVLVQHVWENLNFYCLMLFRLPKQKLHVEVFWNLKIARFHFVCYLNLVNSDLALENWMAIDWSKVVISFLSFLHWKRLQK